MGLSSKFSKGDVAALFAKKLALIRKAIIQSLSYLGEQCVNHARSVNTYRDQTGNLRNSIGYVIVENGQIIKSNFQRSASITTTSNRGKTKVSKGSQDGVVTGAELAAQLASEMGSGFALIVVAGMNYAAAVESRGLDVLTSAEQLAETELPRMIAELKADVAAMK